MFVQTSPPRRLSPDADDDDVGKLSVAEINAGRCCISESEVNEEIRDDDDESDNEGGYAVPDFSGGKHDPWKTNSSSSETNNNNVRLPLKNWRNLSVDGVNCEPPNSAAEAEANWSCRQAPISQHRYVK